MQAHSSKSSRSSRASQLDGLLTNVLPLTLMTKTFTIQDCLRFKTQVNHRQLLLTPAYALTDYRSQGQTLVPVIVNIRRPLTGELTPFNVCVALSQGKSHDRVRLLHDFEDKLFMSHPCKFSHQEDARL